MTSAAPLSHPPLEGRSRVIATVALALATFMNVLDTTIANVSIPAIAGNLGVSPNQGTWVLTSFAVSNAISLPLSGWLAQRFGQVRVFVVSLLLFVLASALCGMSRSIEMLIIFRVFQGLVAGPMIPLSSTLLLHSYPPEKSAMAQSIWAMTALVAPVMGPVLGGWISDNLSWPWVFYINIPTGLFSAWLCWRVFRHRESALHKVPIDYVGLGLLVVWVGALQILLDKGKELGWFESSEIVTLAVVAGIGFCSFLIWELTEEHPVVELRFFIRRNFLIGTIAAALGYCLYFGNVVILPLWMQQFMGYTATWAGLATAPVGILAILFAPAIGKILPKTDPRFVAIFSFVIFSLTAFMRTRFTTGVSFMDIVVPQFIQGAATVAYFVSLSELSLLGLKSHQIASAAGLWNFVRITAGAFGASIFTTQWQDRTILHHAQLAEFINPFSTMYSTATGALETQGLSFNQSMATVDRIIDQQAATLACAEFFWLSAYVFVILIAVTWLAHPRQTNR